MPTIDEEAAHVVGTKKPVDPVGMWVIYDHPKDFPQGFIARQFFIGPRVLLASDETKTGETLDAVRRQLPTGLYNVGRHDRDDAVVVETWV